MIVIKMEPNKENITILWLDDMRNPLTYFNKTGKAAQSGAFIRNNKYYSNVFNKYKPNFVWVKNIQEFTNYTKTHGLPDLVSFDHDLGVGLEKGAVCANWLVDYCKKTNQQLPKCYAHSANPNGIREINQILGLSESKAIRITKDKLTEMIYNSITKFLF